ncbi:rhodopsin [Rubrobacter xylanophilus DSM 9941]|uniref:Rhodopsin n=1 Tax=Rubrobacter xylanophilus (strain DSM 9941 / JCM 11954 / NBRC 16129 / PRD-1) TaxID=266117 RepID=Q1AUE6_RUBXD|nr:bacteriorhodopsin [Rubrobacter xylanophilus]ABG04982.1 rhodopsin [Rubrobacter xylanophilus DSM 9941]6KFQ_A Chain A, Rhodopsin [Rubrobacter xylanophilus DSM 9941]
MEALWLWIGFVGMLLGTLYFAFLLTNAPEGTRYFFVITATITGIAAIAYLVMATGSGSTVLPDGREFYWARYIDWVITTPLLLLDLCLLALADPRRNVTFIASLIALDVVMILTGLWAGATVNVAGRAILFIISTAAFIGVLYLLVSRLFAEASRRTPAVAQIFRTLAVLTIVLWICYPIVWLIGTEGFGAVSLSVEVFLFMVLDLLAKVGFGLLLLSSRQALSDIGSGAVAGTARRVA